MEDPLFCLAAAAAPVVFGVAFVLFVRRQRRRPFGPRALRLVVGNLLAAAAILAAAFVAFEAYYRFAYDATDSFGLDRATIRWFERHWRRNAQGFRDDRDYAASRTPGRLRVSFLGDSFAAGHGVERVEDRLANRIRARHPEWEVHCIARPGIDTRHQIDLLAGLLDSGYELDVVVLVYCPNDIMSADPRTMGALRRIYADSHEPGFWLRHSYAASVLYHRTTSRRNPHVADYCSFAAAAYDDPLVWADQRRDLTMLQAMIERAGGRLVVATFPFLHEASDPERRARTHDRLAAFWRERGVPHLDLRAAVETVPLGERVVNDLDPHPSARTHAAAAEAISAFLTSRTR